MLFPLQQLVCLQSLCTLYSYTMSVHNLMNWRIWSPLWFLRNSSWNWYWVFIAANMKQRVTVGDKTLQEKLLAYWKYYNLIFIYQYNLYIHHNGFILFGAKEESWWNSIFLYHLWIQDFKRSFDCHQCYHSRT